MERNEKFSLIAILLLVVMIGVTSVSSQTQRRFFIKKKKPYTFSLFIGAVRGMGGAGRIRIVKRVNAELLIGVASFVNSRYLSPYPGNTVSFSFRLRTNLSKNIYFAGGWYNGIFDITDNIKTNFPQIMKFLHGGSLSIGFRNVLQKNINIELGALFGLPDKISEMAKENILITSKREPKELPFLPLVTVMIDL